MSHPPKRRAKKRHELSAEIRNAWAFSIVELHLSVAEFWASTPNETRILEALFKARELRADRRCAAICCAIARLGGNASARIEDFLIKPEPTEPADIGPDLAHAFDFLKHFKQ
jgi:hypothetical protein